MCLVYLVAGLASAYVVVTLAYFAQTWLIFPTHLAQAAQPRLPAAAERLEIEAPDRVRLVGVRMPAARDTGGPVLLGFAGNAWNADSLALYLHGLFPDLTIVTFHYRGYRPSGRAPRPCSTIPFWFSIVCKREQVSAASSPSA